MVARLEPVPSSYLSHLSTRIILNSAHLYTKHTIPAHQNHPAETHPSPRHADSALGSDIKITAFYYVKVSEHLGKQGRRRLLAEAEGAQFARCERECKGMPR